MPAKILPLADRQVVIGPLPPVHPGIDLVLDTVMIGRAHQDMGRQQHVLSFSLRGWGFHRR